jgi:hypothetical protein
MMSKAKILVVLVVVVSLGLASCGGSRSASTPGVTVEDLTGVWKHTDRALYFEFSEDGTYQGGPSVDSVSQYEIGQFQLDGALLTFTAGDEGIYCRGLSGSYQAELTEQGQLDFELQEDECPDRANVVPGSYEQVSP